jgi:hypothetical protein
MFFSYINSYNSSATRIPTSEMGKIPDTYQTPPPPTTIAQP